MHIARFSNPAMHQALFGDLVPRTGCDLDHGFRLEVENGIGRFTNSHGQHTTMQLEPDLSGQPLRLWLTQMRAAGRRRVEVPLKEVGHCLTFTLTTSDHE